jgi:hypothetical protein
MFRTIFILAIMGSIFGQEQKNSSLKPGTYGAYADYSLYTELKLFADNTFEFNHTTLNGIRVLSLIGKWKQKGDTLILKTHCPKRLIVKRFLVKQDTLFPIKTANNMPYLTYRK